MSKTESHPDMTLRVKYPLSYHCRRHKRHKFGPWFGKVSLEEEMVTHSSILAWRIPWTEEPGDRVAKSQTGLKRLSTHRIKSALPLPPQLVPWWDQNHSGVACATL